MSYIWTPSQNLIDEANITAFMRKHGIENYEELIRRSTEDIAWFWRSFLDEMNFVWHTPYRKLFDTEQGWAWTKWFIGGKFNWVYNALDRHIENGHGDKIAFKWESEDGNYGAMTYRELLESTLRLCAGLRELGFEPGDRVGIYLPMIPEIIVAVCAVSRIGGILVPIFSGFGPDAIATRLRHAQARFLITADGFYRRGKFVPMKKTADEALKRVHSLEHVVVVRKTNISIPFSEPRDVWWDDVIKHEPKPDLVATDAEAPYMIIYTSGTTGRPKGTVHVHTGFPIKSAQDIHQLFDLKPHDTLFWITDMGWMMGPWEVSGVLLLGGTFFIYDGAPNYPGPDRVWAMVDRHNITILGLTPTFIRAILPAGLEPVNKHSLESLRILGSTGEPWNPDPWIWTIKHIGKERCPIINYSGGTEISGGILGCVPILPLKPGSFHGPVPGMDADVVDDEGKPVRGEPGELILKKPWPGMTRGFWQDPDRYIETYWKKLHGVWTHGDLVVIDADGYWYILGRSDDTLKVAGKRLGPAEMESLLVEHPAVKESAVVGVPDEIKGEVPVCFVVLKHEELAGDELKKELYTHITHKLGKAFAPRDILFVPDLPKTRNAKIMRRLLRQVYRGEELGDTSSLVNPEVLDYIRTLLQ